MGISPQHDVPTRLGVQADGRRFVPVAAAAVIALAAMFAFVASDEPSDGRIVAADVPSPADPDAPDEVSGVVRARGRGIVDERLSDALTATPSTIGPSSTRGPDPRPTGGSTRDEVEDEMRERFGPFVDTPAGQVMVDAATELVEGGESVDDAVDEVGGPSPPPDRSDDDPPDVGMVQLGR